MNEPVLADLVDIYATTERLISAGLSASAAGGKASLLAGCARALLDRGITGSRPAAVFCVPGRIEVVGKHTDYGGGHSIVAAPERGFCLVAVARDDALVRIFDVVWDDCTDFAIDPDLTPTVGAWPNYPMTVARRIARNFPDARTGADIALASDLPSAAGMSSSSAMMVASFLALSAVNRISDSTPYRENIHDMLDLASYLGTVENGQTFRGLAGDKGVGTFGGSEDHAAMLCSVPATLSRFRYCPVGLAGRVPMPEGHVFAIASSGVAAEKTGRAMDKYNRVSHLLAVVADLWRRASGRDDASLGDALGGSAGVADRVRDVLRNTSDARFGRGELLGRFEHFFAENERIVPAVFDALERGGIAEFGRQVDLSQKGAEALLGNQVRETVVLARLARELGAAAASAFGAGFGGSVWALVKAGAAAELLERWAEGYKAAFPAHAEKAAFFETHAGPAAFELQ